MKPHARPMADVRRGQTRRDQLDTLATIVALFLIALDVWLLAASAH